MMQSTILLISHNLCLQQGPSNYAAGSCQYHITYNYYVLYIILTFLFIVHYLLLQTMYFYVLYIMKSGK